MNRMRLGRNAFNKPIKRLWNFLPERRSGSSSTWKSCKLRTSVPA